MNKAPAPFVVRDPVRAHADIIAQFGSGYSVALVPTMGALHDGHLSLVRLAKQHADIVVVSIFVNPTQFSKGEDLDRYPRDEGGDLERLAAVGADAVFLPTVEAMYPTPDVVTVNPGPVGGWYEGQTRKRHFAGALSVVNKLFNIIRPTVAVFGQKDAQQLFLVRRMVHDMRQPIEIISAPTVRDSDGLALSSRNAYLDREERTAATVLYRALQEAQEFSPLGVDAAVRAAQGVVMAETLAKLDYLVIVDPATFQPVSSDFHGDALAIAAAKLGDTRIIDNITLSFP